jgi:hypothetical protein
MTPDPAERTRGRGSCALSGILFSSVLVGLAGPAAGAQEAPQAEEWLPPRVQRGAVEQLATRFMEANVGPQDAGIREDGARQVIERLRTRLESWGEAGVVEHAPDFGDIGLPTTGQPLVDAMARYHACNMLALTQHLDRESQTQVNPRMTAALGLSAYSLAVVYLRTPFLVAGGSPATIEALLAGEEMATALKRFQDEPETMTVLSEKCGPLLAELLESP